MPLHVWILLGKAATRKGSTIRALTGVSHKSSRPIEVMLENRQSIQLSTRVMSLNEADETLEADSWISQVATPCRRNLLIALRLDHPPNSDIDRKFVETIAKSGAIIESVVTLGEATPQWVIDLGCQFASINVVAGPTNGIAAEIRSLWGWR